MEVDIPYRLVLAVLILAAVVGVVVQVMYGRPMYPRAEEGFYGGVARGSGQPDCLRTLPEGASLLEWLDTHRSPLASDASADRAELELLLSKMACLKKDLLSPSGVVEATLHQAFETAHDRMPVGEVCGMCLQQTISSRDLDLVMEQWLARGRVLIRVLSTACNWSEGDVGEVEKLWQKAWNDVYDVATSRCLKVVKGPILAGRDAAPYEPEHLKDARSYDYRYGGLSASGWNGAV